MYTNVHTDIITLTGCDRIWCNGKDYMAKVNQILLLKPIVVYDEGCQRPLIYKYFIFLYICNSRRNFSDQEKKKSGPLTTLYVIILYTKSLWIAWQITCLYPQDIPKVNLLCQLIQVESDFSRSVLLLSNPAIDMPNQPNGFV